MIVRILRSLIKRTKNKGIELLLPFLSEEKRFSLIYKTSYWLGNPNQGSKSGSGSSMDATENIRRELVTFIKNNDISSMLDIPCGDYFWLSQVKMPLKKYIGADIVEQIVLDNNMKHSSSNREFLKLDLIKDILPQCDLVLVRDCLVHLTNEQIMLALKNIYLSGSSYLATSHFLDCEVNKPSLESDLWRPINLSYPPFNLPTPLAILDDSYKSYTLDVEKKIAVWRISELTNILI